MLLNNSNVKPYFCVFCKDQDNFMVKFKVEFEEHLTHDHNVLFEVSMLLATNFLDTDKKKSIIDQGKQLAQNEVVFMCTFCSDETTFVVGQSQNFKDHLWLVHSIFHERDLLLAVHFVDDSFEDTTFLNVYPVNTSIKELEEDITPYKYSKEEELFVECKSEKILSDEILPPIKTTKKSVASGLRCNLCPFSTKKLNVASNKVIRLHLKNVHFVCKICENICDNENNLNSHFKSSHYVDDNRIKCSIDGCSKTSREASIYMHIQTVHQNVVFNSDRLKIEDRKLRKSVCNTCGVTVITQYLNQHTREKHEDSPLLNCAQCEFSTKLARNLKEHASRHVEMFRCKICEESFTKQIRLRKHKILFHGGGQLTCANCDYKTWCPKNLRRHKESHEEKTIYCDQCEYIGKGSYQMRSHMNIHRAPRYKCGKCDYTSYNRGNLYNHRIMKHGDTILKCDECNFSSKSKRTVKIHRERVHK